MTHVRFPDTRKRLLKGLAALNGLTIEKYLESLVLADASAKGIKAEK